MFENWYKDLQLESVKVEKELLLQPGVNAKTPKYLKNTYKNYKYIVTRTEFMLAYKLDFVWYSDDRVNWFYVFYVNQSARNKNINLKDGIKILCKVADIALDFIKFHGHTIDTVTFFTNVKRGNNKDSVSRIKLYKHLLKRIEDKAGLKTFEYQVYNFEEASYCFVTYIK